MVSQVDVLDSSGSHVVGANLDGRLVVLFDVDRGLEFNADLIQDNLNPNHFVKGQ